MPQTLTLGSNAPDVTLLQTTFNNRPPTVLPLLLFDDNFGSVTLQRVKEFQANTVRIVWAIRKDLQPGSSDIEISHLDALIANAKANHLIPQIELYDGTGEWNRLQDLVNYWIQPAVVNIIKKHQAYLLLNIGNEVGDDNVTEAQFIAGYTNAIRSIRTAGIHTPLVIDAADWGQNLALLDATALTLLNADLDRNRLFSVHIYWSKFTGVDANEIRSRLQNSVNLGYSLIVGEFSKFGGYAGENVSICSDDGEIDYLTIIEVCDQNAWYAWEWEPGNDFNDPQCDVMDTTPDQLFASLKPGWAEEVATSSPYSIKNTSVTPPTM